MSSKGDWVLVTGGAGFIGSHLVEQLVEKGYNVRVLDVLSRGTLRYIRPLIDKGRIEYVDSDIRYKDAVDKAMKGIDYVFHEAATNINRSMAYPEESFDVNFRGAQVVFKSALDHNVKKLMFASSASVYGQPKVLPMSENAELNPITPYCVSKLASEYLLKFYTRFGLKWIAFRYFNVYGLRQHTDAYYTSVIIIFLKRLLNNESPIVSGTGRQAMDFVNVRDVVSANIMGMESDVSNEIFNVGTGKTTSIKDIAEKLIKIYGKKIEPTFKVDKAKEELVSERRADVEKAKAMLGFVAKIGIDEGLKEVAMDIIEHPERY